MSGGRCGKRFSNPPRTCNRVAGHAGRHSVMREAWAIAQDLDRRKVSR